MYGGCNRNFERFSQFKVCLFLFYYLNQFNINYFFSGLNRYIFLYIYKILVNLYIFYYHSILNLMMLPTQNLKPIIIQCDAL